MCEFENVATRLSEKGIDIGDTALTAVVSQWVLPVDESNIVHDGNHPMDDMIDLFVVGN